MRIRRTGYKVLYFMGCIAIYVVITNVILLPLLPAGPMRGSIQLVLGFLVVVGACRLFRGPGEDIVPRRPWWRATNRPKASIVLGILNAIGILLGIIVLVIGQLSTGELALTFYDFLSAIEAAFLTWFYFNSAIHLRYQITAQIGTHSIATPSTPA